MVARIGSVIEGRVEAQIGFAKKANIVWNCKLAV